MNDLTLDTPVGVIASGLPGAAARFRAHDISFCCGGGDRLADAARARGLDPQVLLAELASLADSASRDAPQDTAALIDHIVTRYHDRHRSDLAELILLSRKVEAVHGDHEEAPHGLADLLSEMEEDMTAHMLKEEQILFPMMRMGGHFKIDQPIAAMRADHESHGRQLAGLEHLTRGYTLPEGACRSWTALYRGVGAFADDLVAHMHLENDVLFPRFEKVPA